MLMTPLCLETKQNILPIDPHDLKSVASERSIDRLDSAQLGGQSIMAVLNIIALYLQKYADQMRDKQLNTAAELAGRGVEGAFQAFHKTKNSAETELFAKQRVYGAQIAAGVLTIGIAGLGFGAAKYAHNLLQNTITGPEAILAVSSLSNGVAGGISNIVTSGTEKSQAVNFTKAQIEKAQANNQLEILSFLKSVQSSFFNWGGGMSSQYGEINAMARKIFEALSECFKIPMA